MAIEYKRIVLRKGVESELPEDLLPGELAFTTDTKKLFIGSNTGNKEIPVENIEINDITDVDTTGFENGDVLKYSTTTSKWGAEKDKYVTEINITNIIGTETKIITLTINGQEQGISTILTNALNLNDISGVSISNEEEGNVLKYNGTQWENVGLPMESLSNVAVSDIQTGEVLKWNGSLWTNTGDTDSQITVDTFGFETDTYNLQLQQTNGTDYEVDFRPVVVKDFKLNQAAPLYQIDLTLQDDTVLSADLTGLKNSDVNNVTFNTSNDGVLSIHTVGGSTYDVDLDGRFITNEHRHGKIDGDGQIPPDTVGIDVDIETGDKLVIINSGAESTITTADITFDTTETSKYLSQAGEFSQPGISDVIGLQDEIDGKAEDDHEHGQLRNDGTVKIVNANQDSSLIDTGDHILIAKNSGFPLAGALRPTQITFDTTQGAKFLSQDGTFKTIGSGSYQEQDITELVTSGTYAFSNLSSYNKLIAVLYSDTNASFNTTAGVSDTVEIRQDLQLHFETYEDPTSGTCFVGGEPTLAENQQECETSGGTWVPTTFTSFGKVEFQPGGKLERVSSTNVQFTQPTAVNGHTWKLKIIGVTF